MAKQAFPVEEVRLELLQDAPKYMDKMLRLVLIDTDGDEMAFDLDGIQVGDIINDARRCGIDQVLDLQ